MRRRAMAAIGTATGLVIVAFLTRAGPSHGAIVANSSDSVAVAVFEGRTPCGQIAVEFTGFPSSGCEKIKWELTLFRDRATGRPSSFLYEGTRTTKRGTWTIHRGLAGDPNATVYRLTPIPPGQALSLLSVNEKVLLLLDGEQRVLVGDASWSYVLNRTDRKLPK